MNIRKALAAVIASLAVACAWANTWTDPVTGITWTYTVSGGEASLGGDSLSSPAVPKSTTGAIAIPSSLGGKPVTSVGRYAYYNCSGLTSVTIPDSVTSIGGGAFADCSGLASVTIPDSVTNIGHSAFNGCSGLPSVTIPDSVTSIGDWAFYYCRGLTSVTIGNGVTSIGDRAFYYCRGLTSVDIPASVTSIGAEAFAECSGITSLVMPNTVTNIGRDAFSRCSNLKSVTIPQYLCDKDIWSFRGRFDDVFSSNYSYYGITNLIIAEGVTNIADRAFDTADSLRNLTSVTIPSSVKNIGRRAFPSSSKLQYINISDLAAWCAISFQDLSSHPFITVGLGGTLVLNGVPIQGNLEIPDGVTSIGDYAFAFLRNITSVTIPPSVTNIGTGAFRQTYSCATVYISDLSAWCKIRFEDLYSNPLYVGNGRLCLNGEELQGRLVVPNDVDVIGRAAFYNCSGLTEVVIGNATTEIGERAFQRCSGLMSIIVGEDNLAYKSENGLLLSKDGKSLVQGVNGNVMIPNSVTNIASYAFYGCTNLTSIAMTDSVTGIGSYAFYGCGGLASVTIPGGVTSIGDSAFRNCANLRSFIVAEGSTTYKSVSGLLLSKDGKDLLFGVNRDVTIPDGVTNIANKAFYDCSGLTSLTIPDSVTSIGDYAFYNCSGLTSLTIGNGVVNIGDRSFSGCSGLTSLTIPDSVTSIGDYAFYYCSGLTSLTIPDSVTSIGEWAFSGCSGLTSVMIPNSVTSIGKRAFEDCSGLTSVTIGNGVTNIGQSAFYGLNSLSRVTIGSSVKTIDTFAFWSCKSLDSVTFTGDAPAASSAFSFVKSGCVAYVKRTANGFPAEGAKWNDLTVRYYGGSVATGTMTGMEGCEYIIVANDDETLTERDITFTAVVGNTLVDTTKGYNVKVAADGKSATARLKTPILGAVVVAEVENSPASDEGDPSGVLVLVDENELATKPTVKNGEEVGALPVTAVPGLYYQAAWGSDLDNLTPGVRVQAMTDTLYLGVIKQTGTSGFYKVTVSEQ